MLLCAVSSLSIYMASEGVYNFIHGVGVQAQAPDDLSVRRGDWVYADLNNQTVDGWLWAYAPKTRNSAV